MNVISDWIRVYVDREKLSRIYNRKIEGKAEKIVRMVRHVDVQSIFAKLPLTSILPDDELEEAIKQTTKGARSLNVGSAVELALAAEKGSSSNIVECNIVVVQALKDMREQIRVTSPTGRSLPILSAGSYIVYRPPFERIPLFDGEYHVAYLVNIVDNPGDYDMLKILVKESHDIDVEHVLLKFNNYHARALGVIAPATPYVCKIRGSVASGYESWSTRFVLYPLVISVYPPADYKLTERLNLWQSWNS